MEPSLLLFAFAAGAAAFFSPCCIAMLPAYVGYALRGPSGEGAPRPPFPQAAGPGRFLAVAGLLPLTAGSVPLLLTGMTFTSSLPYRWGIPLPSTGESLTLTLGGLGITGFGFILLGKAPLALRGATFGSLATAGFLVAFLALGLPVAFVARWLAPYTPWLAVFVGVGLVLLGMLMLTGRTLAPKLPGLRADVSSPRGFFLFGIGYGVASLSCTFPLFLAVVASAALAGGFQSASAVFVAYALGKAALLIGVTVLTVAGGAAMGAKVKRLTPYVTKASALLLIVAGAYVAYYFGRYAPGLA